MNKVTDIISEAKKNIETVLGCRIRLHMAKEGVFEINLLLMQVATALGIFPDRLKTKDRYKELVYARAIYCYLCFSLVMDEKPSTVAIGKLLNRDHSTVLNSLQTAVDMLDTNEAEFMNMYYTVVEKLNLSPDDINFKWPGKK